LLVVTINHDVSIIKAVRGRRRSSLRHDRTTAQEAPTKTFELEQRIGRLEIVLQELRALIESHARNTTALEAQLDHIAAKLHITL
jgi:uncharacterized coiled-coil protein SlyX